MSDDKTGGPAFPFEYHNQTATYQPGFFGTGNLPPGASQQFAGMTLRDWFAGQALTGFLANFDDTDADAAKRIGLPVEEALAKASYSQADAMLAERAKSK